MGGGKSKLSKEDAAVVESKPTSLNLSKRGYKTIPKTVTKATTVTSLDLSKNELAKVKPSLAGLTGLTDLNLASNDLTELPPDLAKNSKLQVLNLAFNPLRAIPPVVQHLPHLADIKIGFTTSGKGKAAVKLKGEATSAATKRAKAAKDGKKLKKEPKPLFVVDPELFNPAKSSLPASLTSLALPGCALRDFPTSILNCKRLTSLSLGANQFNSLPPDLGSLTNLTSLNLAQNRLTDLPDQLGHLTALTTLKLDGNPLTKLPEDIRTAPPDIVLSYLRSRGGIPEPPSPVLSDPAAGVGDNAGDDDDVDVGDVDVEDVDKLAERVEDMLNADTEDWLLDGFGEGEGEGEGEDGSESFKFGSELEDEEYDDIDDDADAGTDADIVGIGGSVDEEESSTDFLFPATSVSTVAGDGDETTGVGMQPSVSFAFDFADSDEDTTLAPSASRASAASSADLTRREDSFDRITILDVSDATRAEASLLYADAPTPSFVHSDSARSALHDEPGGDRQPIGLFPPRKRISSAPLPDDMVSDASSSGMYLRYDTAEPGRRQPLRLSPDPDPFVLPNARVLIRAEPARDPYAPRRQQR